MEKNTFCVKCKRPSEATNPSLNLQSNRYCTCKSKDKQATVATRRKNSPLRLAIEEATPEFFRNLGHYDTTLTMENMNPRVKAMKYFLRGAIYQRANEIEKIFNEQTEKKFPYTIRADIDDPQGCFQKPLTFLRQVLALTLDKSLLDSCKFPEDVKHRALVLLKECCGSSVGSYTEPLGIEYIRRDVAKFLEKRDGHPSNWEDIILTDGAAEAIRLILNLFGRTIGCKPQGILIPTPTYPLYSAIAEDLDIKLINYHIDGCKFWEVNVPYLKKIVEKAREFCKPKIIVVINPGNPTGNVLQRKTIEEIIKFAFEEKLFIMADEVYQDNMYVGEFISFKKVLVESGKPYDQQELASFMSVSKGYVGEAGLRAGFVEIINLHPCVRNVMINFIEFTKDPSTIGQFVVDVYANPPRQGDPSYPLWIREKEENLEYLKRKAKIAEVCFNLMEGMSCRIVEGSIYAFPEIIMPQKAIEKANGQNVPPDVFYSYALLEKAGIAVLPGSVFGQAPGTWHVRVTLLPPLSLYLEMMDRWMKFHTDFFNEYK